MNNRMIEDRIGKFIYENKESVVCKINEKLKHLEQDFDHNANNMLDRLISDGSKMSYIECFESAKSTDAFICPDDFGHTIDLAVKVYPEKLIDRRSGNKNMVSRFMWAQHVEINRLIDHIEILKDMLKSENEQDE